jgi:hypothetical protein
LRRPGSRLDLDKKTHHAPTATATPTPTDTPTATPTQTPTNTPTPTATRVPAQKVSKCKKGYKLTRGKHGKKVCKKSKTGP